MRYLTALGMVVLIMDLLISAAPCAAQGVPSGSYRQTCRDPRVEGSVLYATCANNDSSWQNTSLPDFRRCRTEIINDNGNLRCSAERGTWQRGYGHDRDRDRREGVPPGNYVRTCRDIRISGATLQANCEKKNGKWRESSLRDFNRCTRGIENDNGKLVCGR
jgi:hypothetical protein